MKTDQPPATPSPQSAVDALKSALYRMRAGTLSDREAWHVLHTHCLGLEALVAAALSEKPATVSGPFRVGEPEDEDDSSTVLGAKGEALTADEIVTWLNYFYGKAHALELDVQAIARNRDEYRERAYEAERKL